MRYSTCLAQIAQGERAYHAQDGVIDLPAGEFRELVEAGLLAAEPIPYVITTGSVVYPPAPVDLGPQRLDLSDGVSDAEATLAGQALKQRRKRK